MGYDKEKQRWVEDKVETWVEWGEFTSGVCKSSPKMAYAGLTILLHQEWQFVHSVTPFLVPYLRHCKWHLGITFSLHYYV